MRVAAAGQLGHQVSTVHAWSANGSVSRAASWGMSRRVTSRRCSSEGRLRGDRRSGVRAAQVEGLVLVEAIAGRRRRATGPRARRGDVQGPSSGDERVRVEQRTATNSR
jgi:hypothetical protein